MRLQPRIVAALVLCFPVLASAGPVPDAATFDRLRSGDWNRYRVLTTRGQHDLTSLVLVDDGIQVGSTRRPGSLQVPPEEQWRGGHRVRWADIERVDGGSGGFSFGRVGAGFLIGTLTGAAVVGLYYAIDRDAGLEQAGVLLAVPIGAIVGTVGGASIRPVRRWQTLYP